MKNYFIILGLFISFASASHAMETAKKTAKLTFTKAQNGDQLDSYKDILLQVYPALLDPMNHQPIKVKAALEKLFDILSSWIGKKGISFIKIEDQGKPVGFTTLESLNEDDTHIAFHLSPLLPEYQELHQQHFDYVKNEFPQVKAVFAAVSNNTPKFQALVKRLGFVEDESFVPNNELILTQEKFTGYKKFLE